MTNVVSFCKCERESRMRVACQRNGTECVAQHCAGCKRPGKYPEQICPECDAAIDQLASAYLDYLRSRR
jgi:hypothetical protein